MNVINTGDDQLVREAQSGSFAAMDQLLEKYRYLVRVQANPLFLVGGDSEDLNQEGMIGLYQAIRDYDETQNMSFVSFASLCIRRQMYKAIEADGRRKHAPLNSAVSLELISDATDYLTASNPESQYIENEEAGTFRKQVEKLLSPYEKKVLIRYLKGMKNEEIAADLDKSIKSVYNAIQRIRSKVTQLR